MDQMEKEADDCKDGRLGAFIDRRLGASLSSATADTQLIPCTAFACPVLHNVLTVLTVRCRIPAAAHCLHLLLTLTSISHVVTFSREWGG
jgi:hypothetical protein